MFRNQGFGISGWNSEMQVVFAYPLPPIPTHFQLILIENQPNPIRIRVTGWLAIFRIWFGA